MLILNYDFIVFLLLVSLMIFWCNVLLFKVSFMSLLLVSLIDGLENFVELLIVIVSIMVCLICGISCVVVERVEFVGLWKCVNLMLLILIVIFFFICLILFFCLFVVVFMSEYNLINNIVNMWFVFYLWRVCLNLNLL